MIDGPASGAGGRRRLWPRSRTSANSPWLGSWLGRRRRQPLPLAGPEAGAGLPLAAVLLLSVPSEAPGAARGGGGPASGVLCGGTCLCSGAGAAAHVLPLLHQHPVSTPCALCPRFGFHSAPCPLLTPAPFSVLDPLGAPAAADCSAPLRVTHLHHPARHPRPRLSLGYVP